MAQRQCSVCGYKLPKEASRDKQCPVCGAKFDRPASVAEENGAAKTTAIPAADPDTKWRCIICGYIHTGPTPPESCPVCGADASKFERINDAPQEDTATSTHQATPPTGTQSASPQEQPIANSTHAPLSKRTWIESKLVELHGHPIAVHIPNGVLPVTVLFLLAGVIIGSEALIQASFFNTVVVLLAMPAVVYAGWIDWRHRFGGNMTPVFKTKIICATIVTLALLVVVVWRLFDPLAGTAYGSGRWMYIGLHLVALAAGGVAGFYGGKLIIFPGDKK